MEQQNIPCIARTATLCNVIVSEKMLLLFTVISMDAFDASLPPVLFLLLLVICFSEVNHTNLNTIAIRRQVESKKLNIS